MKKFQLTGLVLILALFAPAIIAGESDLKLPPILQREYGKVLVSHGWGAKKVRFHNGMNRKKGSTRIVAPKSATDAEVAALLLNDFWDGKFRNQELAEFAPINREVFLKHGTSKLTGKKSDATQLIHDWWNVRMGVPLPISKTYQIVAINIYHDDGGSEVGHFCIGVRKIGGDAENDFVIDLRAPWTEDRAATMAEAINHDNSLINQLIPNNLYDWMWTQSELRGCRNELWFCNVSDAQVRLLQTIPDRDSTIKVGPFRPLKSNCASLGKLIVNRILPFDMPIENCRTIADIPKPVAKKMAKRFGGELTFEILREHQSEGMEPTSASKIHRAQPSRASSIEFLTLKKVPEIN